MIRGQGYGRTISEYKLVTVRRLDTEVKRAMDGFRAVSIERGQQMQDMDVSINDVEIRECVGD